jgi:hypothetical protein
MTEQRNQAGTKAKPKTTKIFVNRQAVELPGDFATGAEIEAAAGVPPEFDLFRKHGSELDPVAKDTPVELHEGEHFIAVSGQDVS